MSQAAAQRRKSEGQLAAEEWDFAGVANAQVVKHAEAYYRTLFFGGTPCTCLTQSASSHMRFMVLWTAFHGSFVCLRYPLSASPFKFLIRTSPQLRTL